MGELFSDKADHAGRRRVINTIQIIVGLIILGSAMSVSMYWWNRELFVEVFAGKRLGNLVARCDSTAEALDLDFKCMVDRDCLLSTDELIAHDKRLERYTLLCTTEME